MADYQPKFNPTAFVAGYTRKSQAPKGVLTGYLQGGQIKQSK